MKILLRFLLCLMLCAQFATLVHAYEHDTVHEEEEHCVSCLLHADFKFALIDASLNDQHVTNRSAIDAQIIGHAPNNLFQLHNIRSPPLLLQ